MDGLIIMSQEKEIDQIQFFYRSNYCRRSLYTNAYEKASISFFILLTIYAQKSNVD